MTDFITQKLTVNPNGVGDFAAEWMTKEDWDNYANLGINKPHQESYVAEVTLARNPLFEDQVVHDLEYKSSHRMVILDFSDETSYKNQFEKAFNLIDFKPLTPVFWPEKYDKDETKENDK